MAALHSNRHPVVQPKTPVALDALETRLREIFLDRQDRRGPLNRGPRNSVWRTALTAVRDLARVGVVTESMRTR